MEVFEAIERRHSYRGGFKTEAVPREHLRKIVQAGLKAPSGCNAQTTSFVIVDNADTIAQLAGVVDKQVVREAAAVIVCLVDHKEVYHGMAFGVEDCAAAVENILLAVTALGYATVWIDGALRRDHKAERIAALLGVPSNLQVRIVLPLGISGEKRTQPEKKPFEERAWFNNYGG